MFKYEFFGPALRGLSPSHAARVLKALDAAILYGAIEYSEGRMPDREKLKKKYNEVVSGINGRDVFGNVAEG